MSEELVICTYCECSVQQKNLDKHVRLRCPKAPEIVLAARGPEKSTIKRSAKSAIAVQEEIEARVEAFRQESKRNAVLVRGRLERLYKDLSSNTAVPDDPELAKLFKAFYTMYVWDGTLKKGPHRSLVDGEQSESIHAVSGGLPSLGKRAR